MLSLKHLSFCINNRLTDWIYRFWETLGSLKLLWFFSTKVRRSLVSVSCMETLFRPTDSSLIYTMLGLWAIGMAGILKILFSSEMGSPNSFLVLSMNKSNLLCFVRSLILPYPVLYSSSLGFAGSEDVIREMLV